MQPVKIEAIESIKAEPGKYGPQKKIVFIDVEGHTISGWVSERDFNPEEWVPGKTLELEISRNGKYTNFKYRSKSKQSTDKVMEALRATYKLLLDLQKDFKTFQENQHSLVAMVETLTRMGMDNKAKEPGVTEPDSFPPVEGAWPAQSEAEFKTPEDEDIPF